VFGAALVVIAISVIVIGLSSATAAIEGMQRVAMPGHAQVVLPVGPSTLYVENRSKVGERVIDTTVDDVRDDDDEGWNAWNRAAGVACDLDGPPGSPKVALSERMGHVHYSVEDYAGIAAFDVVVDTGGTYQLTCKSNHDLEFAIAIGAGVGARIVIGLLGLIPMLGGIGLLIVTFVRRFRAARRAAAAG
jgi:hypothetical protein